MKKALYFIITVFYLLLLNTSGVLGQSATLMGNVTDAKTKQTLPFAWITLLRPDMTKAGGTTSDYDGNYIMKPITPGIYHVSASFVGYKTVLIENCILTSDSINKLDIGLFEGATIQIDDHSDFLISIDEPKLSEISSTEVYRFLWIPSFDHPISIRIQKINNSIKIYWKITNGNSNQPGRLIKKGSKKLSIEDWNSFKHELNKIDFWNFNAPHRIQFDGSSWILEGKEPARYHIVDSDDGEVINTACLKLLKLTRLKNVKIDY